MHRQARLAQFVRRSLPRLADGSGGGGQTMWAPSQPHVARPINVSLWGAQPLQTTPFTRADYKERVKVMNLLRKHYDLSILQASPPGWRRGYLVEEGKKHQKTTAVITWFPQRGGSHHVSIHIPTNRLGLHVTEERKVFIKAKPSQIISHWYFNRNGKCLRKTQQIGSGRTERLFNAIPKHVSSAAETFLDWKYQYVLSRHRWK